VNREAERANYLPVSGFHRLDYACRWVAEAWCEVPWLVGSCLARADYRDVDVRLTLADERFLATFPNVADPANPFQDPLYWLICTAVSEHLSTVSGLTVDFQLQAKSVADTYHGERVALGLVRAQSGAR
jgi:hypothetical protein